MQKNQNHHMTVVLHNHPHTPSEQLLPDLRQCRYKLPYLPRNYGRLSGSTELLSRRQYVECCLRCGIVSIKPFNLSPWLFGGHGH